VTTSDGTAAAPYVKAAVRDTKAYMKKKGGRYIPMGYSAADIASIRPMFQDYLVCGDPATTIDFFAVNIYEWVPQSFTGANCSVVLWIFKPLAIHSEWPSCRDTLSRSFSARPDVTSSVPGHSAT